MFGKYARVLTLHILCTAVLLRILNSILPGCISCVYSYTANILMYLIVAGVTFRYTKKNHLNEKLPPYNRAVLITGCDSGFGHLLAKKLDSQGFHVFASCLNPGGEGACELIKSCSKILQVLGLDVRSDESVKKALEFIKHNLGTSGLKYVVSEWLYDTKKVDPYKKAVLITGCDRGFGHLLAKRLDSQGYHVFASCLFPLEDGALNLKKNCSKRLQILPLDVKNDDSVKEAVRFIKNKLGSSKLWAVVNNAGVHRGLSLDFTTLDDYKECMEVNAFGMIRVTKAFLPMLRETQGRVVNMISILGRFGVPHGSPYVMSKFAAAAFNDCIRQELNVWGIRVICVEPELFATHLTKNGIIRNIDKTISSSDPSIKSLYGKEYLHDFRAYAEWYLTWATPKRHLVLDALEDAVSLERPWPAYRPSRNFFTKFLLWDYELKTHVMRDAITNFFLSSTGFPRPKLVDSTPTPALKPIKSSSVDSST